MAPGGFPFGRFLCPWQKHSRVSSRPHEGRRQSSRGQTSVLTRAGIRSHEDRIVNKFLSERKHLHPTKVKAKTVH